MGSKPRQLVFRESISGPTRPPSPPTGLNEPGPRVVTVVDMRNRALLPVAFLLAGALPVAAQEARPGWVVMPDGIRLRYDAVGSGPHVVLIPHGFELRADLERLASDDRTLVFYDARNRGRSDSVEDSTRISIDADVADVEALRVALGAEKVSLVGYSVYGLVTALYTIEHPNRVRRLVQVGPVPIAFDPERYPTAPSVVDSAARARIAQLESQGMPADRPEAFCRQRWEVTKVDLVGDPAAVARLRPPDCTLRNEWWPNFQRHLRHHFGSVLRVELDRERIRATPVPVLTIHGTLDRNAAYAGGREWAATFPMARLLTIEGAAHRSWVDDPDGVLGAIDAFLDGEWPEGVEEVEEP
jgi:pimeloyl-ACP methyl ester carboxylesterase